MAILTIGIRYTQGGNEKRIDNLTYAGYKKLVNGYARKNNTHTNKVEFYGDKDVVIIDRNYFDKMEREYQ